MTAARVARGRTGEAGKMAVFLRRFQEAAMIAPNQLFDDFQKNMSEFLAKTPAADIERNMKAFMTQAFSRMDLVTREEFDIQADLLARALERVESLEARVQALEQGDE
jgi:BMFP domain-containing protein YqiC